MRFGCRWLLLAAVSSGSVMGADATPQADFGPRIAPFLRRHCIDCHGPDLAESGVRLDRLDGTLPESSLRLWETIRGQLAGGAMPPEGETRPTADQRRLVVKWIDEALDRARSRPAEKNGSVRRLTVAQYGNTLRDLLGIDDDLTDVLPPDAVTKDGFVNDEQTLLLSPRLLEAFVEIAERALDVALVDPDEKPVVQTFRVDLGRAVNPKPHTEKLILGANSQLLRNEDFVVTELLPTKPFEYEPFAMRTKYRFNEGYQGNATVRGWREYDSIYHAVFACTRGKPGYPKGDAHSTVPGALLLRPAIPSEEIWKSDSTYGPQANFKISLRELPDSGPFRVTVTAAKYDDGLLLDRGTKTPGSVDTTISFDGSASGVEVGASGVYRVDVHEGDVPEGVTRKPGDRHVELRLGDRTFTGTRWQPAFLVVRLARGPLPVAASIDGNPVVERVDLVPLAAADPLRVRFEQFEARSPRLGVHLGLRRDCGSTLDRVDTIREITSTDFARHTFEGAIDNYPNPEVKHDNVNYLAGIREIGVRSEYTDGRDRPRLAIQSVEFEGPYYETWPPQSHRNVFLDSRHADDPPKYAREILRAFATRAFRRPVTRDEEDGLVDVWQTSFDSGRGFRRSVRDALVVVLTSPQFLFLIETSTTPEPEPLTEWELASKLSYFLWNTAPDERLRSLAAEGRLHEALDDELDRMVADPRFETFTREYASRWLRLDKFDVVEIDRKRYPRLTRHAREHLRREPAAWLEYLVRGNRPMAELVQSDRIVANEVTAAYYDLGDRAESGFDFEPIPHGGESLGGVLSQASILSGLSDGRRANPVKRGAWLARKIVAEPPADPPPNVPELPETEDESLKLREQLERHRDQKGCAKCHAGIDPWGIPFERFDAGGRFTTRNEVPTDSVLPDGTEVADLQDLKRYLAEDRLDRVAFGFVKHLATYATGRPPTYAETAWLRREVQQFRDAGYPVRDLVAFVVRSPLFLEK